MVSCTSGWSGISRSPTTVSRQAWACGNTTLSRSAARMRTRLGATFLPPRRRATVSARVTFQRQRTSNIGWSSSACTSTSWARCDGTKPNTVASGKLWGWPSESTMPSSVAAACSSKSKPRQKRLRSASPQARLMRPPSGEWITSCMPPASSKNRSAMSRSLRGSAPRTARAAARYATSCSAAARIIEVSVTSQAAIAPRRRRRRAGVDLGAQRRHLVGQLAGAGRRLAEPERDRRARPWASSTSTRPFSTRWIRHEVLPSRNTSPADESIAKSSSTVPTLSPEGSSTTA